MSFFKDQTERDLDIFINLNEFADVHALNGTECKAIIKAPTARESFLSSGSHISDDGIFGISIFVHCRSEDLPELPHQGNVFVLDGEPYIVYQCVEEDGMASIELRAETRGFI